MRPTNKDKEIQFVEKLLRAYKGMKAERYNLNIKWNMLERQRHSAIEGQNMKAVAIDDMPGTPRDSYKESRLLMVKHDLEVEDIENEQSFIVDRLKDLDDIITVIDGSLNSLSHQDKNIVFFYYCERYSLEKIAQMVYLHPQNVYTHKQGALRYLYRSLKALEGTVIFKAS